MKRRFWICSAALFGIVAMQSAAASLPSLWRHSQEFRVTAPGLVKLSLPVETLDAARAGLEDVRLFDSSGVELPYQIERPTYSVPLAQPAASFHVSLAPSATVITVESGLTQPVDEITLESPAASFVKGVRVEGSPDSQSWTPLANGQLIFRQPNGTSQLQIRLPVAGTWKWLQLTVDDARSQPIPFTGARVRAAVERRTGEPLPVRIIQRQVSPGETRLTLSLGAANLNLSSIQLESSEPLFARQVSIVAPQIQGASVREQTFAQAVIYRVESDGHQVSARLSVPIAAQIRSRELLVIIRDLDSPPLAITGVRAERMPVYLTFYARQGGIHSLLTGNPYSAAPHYDLSTLNMSLKNLAVSPVKFAPITDNPDFRPSAHLPGTETNMATLDVSAWENRKRLKLSSAGSTQAELDLEVLAHAQPGFQDLRLMHAGRQVPYLLEFTPTNKTMEPAVKAVVDGKDPHLHRWELKLPNTHLPATRLTCVSPTPLFQRNVTLFESAADSHGHSYRHVLGQATWVQAPNHNTREFVITLDQLPLTDTVVLETNDGDNPPVEFAGFQLSYPVTRLVFNSNANDELFLYYGNPEAESPRYDLSLVADELMSAERSTAELLGEEKIRKSSYGISLPGSGGPLLWISLAVVVAALLIIIARALPAKPPSV